MQRRYEKIRQGDTNLRLIAGKLEDRLLGLDPLFDLSPGFSVLDIGCHQGFVLEKLVDSGAGVVHGVDLHEPSLAIAEKHLAGRQAVFRRVDLCDGMAGLRRALPLLPHYDVILYLGVYHHLARQMSPKDLSAFVTELFPLAGHRLAIRSPEPFLRVLRREPVMHRFRLIHRYSGTAPVSPAEIYEPVGGTPKLPFQEVRHESGPEMEGSIEDPHHMRKNPAPITHPFRSSRGPD